VNFVRLHASLALIGGIVGLLVSSWYWFTPGEGGYQGAILVLSVVQVGLYATGILIGVLDKKATKHTSLGGLFEAGLPVAGIGSFLLAFPLGVWHSLPALLLLSAMVSRPRSPYDALF